MGRGELPGIGRGNLPIVNPTSQGNPAGRGQPPVGRGGIGRGIPQV